LESLEDRSVPATFNVTTTLDEVIPGDGKRSLREAVAAANNLAGEDVIVLKARVYKLAIAGAGDNINSSGDLDIIDTVTIRGAGAGATIIDGQQLDRVFDVIGTAPSSIKVVFEKLAVRNGSVTGHGGGIQFGNANVVVRDSTVVGNRASLTGGGISDGVSPGTGDAKLVRATVARNVAGNGGGGMRVVGLSSLLTVTSSMVRRNLAEFGGGIVAGRAVLTNSTVHGNAADTIGGGIDAGEVTMTGCTVSNNSSDFGGGINSGPATLTECTVSGNFAAIDGGGINTPSATLIRSTISGNTAGERGGGINANTATLTNSTVSGNTAAIEGGGLFATTATLLNCTVVENISNTGGGLFHVAGGTFSVKNTIVAFNLVAFGGLGPNAFGATFTSQGNNLIGDGTQSNGFTDGVNGDIVGTGVNPIDPKLGALANNGGKTKTHALLAGSKAIDAGDNAGALSTDQRGFLRKKDGNGDGIARVDIGAYER
jgi:hypothetical protein